jgi:hypothetical protein
VFSEALANSPHDEPFYIGGNLGARPRIGRCELVLCSAMIAMQALPTTLSGSKCCLRRRKPKVGRTAQVVMSVPGGKADVSGPCRNVRTKRTSERQHMMSAIGGKADIRKCTWRTAGVWREPKPLKTARPTLVCPKGLIDADARRFDRCGPLVDFTPNKAPEIFGRGLIIRYDLRA